MDFLMNELGLSERRSCRIVGQSRSVQQYRPAPKNDTAVVDRLKELASENRRYGSLRLHAMLRREGLVANRKRTYRLYTEQGLQVRTKKRRKLPRRDRVAPQIPARPMQRWSLDFVAISWPTAAATTWRSFTACRRRSSSTTGPRARAALCSNGRSAPAYGCASSNPASRSRTPSLRA